MDCDRAFDLLTRGPVPAGDRGTDEAVERHLAACHDCRCLAEALRPAVDLFHEVLDDEGASLPCYRGSLPVAGGTTAVLSPAVPSPAVLERRTDAESGVESRRKSEGSCEKRGIRWAFVAGGLAACLAVSLPFLGGGSSAPTAVVHDGGKTLGLQLVDGGQAERLESLGLVAACRPGFRIRGTTESLAQCCAVCHAPSAAGERVHAPIASLTTACIVCHTGNVTLSCL